MSIHFRVVFQLKNSNYLCLTVRFNDANQFEVKLSIHFSFKEKKKLDYKILFLTFT